MGINYAKDPFNMGIFTTKGVLQMSPFSKPEHSHPGIFILELLYLDRLIQGQKGLCNTTVMMTLSGQAQIAYYGSNYLIGHLCLAGKTPPLVRVMLVQLGPLLS